MKDLISELALKHGDFKGKNKYRTVVFEADERITIHDFSDLGQAKEYLMDALHETENGVLAGALFDRNFQRIEVQKKF